MRPIPRTKRETRARRIAILVAMAALSWWQLSAAGPAAPANARPPIEPQELAFDQQELVIGATARQAVLTGFLLDETVANIAVVFIDDDGARRLQLFGLDDEGWSARQEAVLSREVEFVDIAEIAGRDRLITYAPGRLRWFDPESAAERELVAVASSFTPPRDDEIAHVDITRRVNGDGRDDLVVPAADGFRVLVQANDGRFAEPTTIGSPPDLSRIYGADGYRYDPWSVSRIHEIDYDRDGRGDLVFWDGVRFVVHLQDESGRFADERRTFTTGVPFDSDRMDVLTVGDMTGRVLHALTDVSGDGVGDLVVFSLTGGGIADKRSVVEVHFGAATPVGGTMFEPEVGLSFFSDDRIHVGMTRHDLDQDGRDELMLTTIDRDYLEGSLWKTIKGRMGDDVWLDLEFYRFEGVDPGAPNATRRIQLDGFPSPREPGWVPLDLMLRGATHAARRTQEIWPRAFNNTLLIGDVTGDGLAELLIGDHPRILEVFDGVPGPSLFTPEPREVRIAVPHDEEYVWMHDLDRDGKQDLVIHHPFTLRDGHGAPTEAPGTEAHRIVTLIAR